MERITVFMVKTSLMYFVTGFLLGAAMLITKGLGYIWLTAVFMPTHSHLLLVGWLVQFVMGIAYWILPRRRTARQPLGYSGKLAFTVYGMLNVGLVLRVVFEPMQIALPQTSPVDGVFLTVSGILQGVAGLLWMYQMWQRARPFTEVRARAEAMMAQGETADTTRGRDS